MSEASRSPSKEGPRPLNRWMRTILYVASALVFLAGFQLFILTDQTATYFAWTIAPSLTAATLGAAYWASVPVEFLAARRPTWATARVAVPGVWVFTTLTLIVTLVHIDRFHLSSPDLAPRVHIGNGGERRSQVDAHYSSRFSRHQSGPGPKSKV